MLKVFEAFSGIGSQRMALRNIGKDYEVVAISEIDNDAIMGYGSIHCEVDKLKDIDLETLNSKINNLGDIEKIDVKNIPNHNVFTYSFPCQDISSVGTRKGLQKGSGTRSSLLWECKKVIVGHKPKYLIMENVKSLVTGKNKENFFKWLKFLEEEGYDNYWKIFDSQYYGIPQRRPRVLLVSKLGKSSINLVKDNEFKNKKIEDILDKSENKWEYFIPKNFVKGSIEDGEILFLDDRDWKMNGVMINKISSTQRAGRTGLKFIKKTGENLYERKLTSLECCRLMGFDDKDYYNMKKMNISNTAIMKLCGNSIVVNVLEVIFRNIYEEEENDNG